MTKRQTLHPQERKQTAFHHWTLFEMLWEDQFGGQYVVTGRDRKAARDLVGIAVPVVRDRMIIYLTDPRWRDRSLWHFVNVINTYGQADPKNPAFTPRPPDERDWQ